MGQAKFVQFSANIQVNYEIENDEISHHNNKLNGRGKKYGNLIYSGDFKDGLPKRNYFYFF